MILKILFLEAKNEIPKFQDFESLIASLAEQASDSGYLMSAVKLSYLIFQDRSCMSKLAVESNSIFLLQFFILIFFLNVCVLIPDNTPKQRASFLFFSEFLIKIFVDSEVFPSDKQPTSQQLERQREALKFFAIFEGRILSDEVIQCYLIVH